MKEMKVPVKDLVLPNCPQKPWTLEQAHEMWEESLTEGHTQLYFKCYECSLEFILLTFKKPENRIPTNEVTCPECGTKGKCGKLGTKKSEGPICEIAAHYQRGEQQ